MKLTFLIMLKCLFFFTPVNKNIPKSIYDFKVAGLNGGTIDFADFKGKKILIVNTTSKDDQNTQFSELEALYKKHKDKLVIIGFPIDDFGQPPVSDTEVSASRRKNYNVTFPLTTKVNVKGDDMSPVYKWLTDSKYNKYKDSEVKWNFQKYLINENGELIAVFDPKVKAESREIVLAIEAQ